VSYTPEGIARSKIFVALLFNANALLLDTLKIVRCLSSMAHFPSSNRIEQKLQNALQNRDFYEAHQLYRTMYFRLLTRQKFEELRPLLFDGACKLLDSNEVTSGVDLANLYIEVLEKAKIPVDQPTALSEIEALYGRIVRKIPCQADAADVRTQFVVNCIRWSKTLCPKYASGHPCLHRTFAVVLWREKCYAMARYHFLRSEDGKECALFLIEYQTAKGYPSEIDLFIAQAVLQFLCVKQTPTANTCFKHYTANHPAIQTPLPPFKFTLLNFLWLLLKCVEQQCSLTQYSILVEKYQVSIQRDPCYPQYLDRIGQYYFGSPSSQKQFHNQSPFGGMFGNLLGSLLSDAGDNDGSDTEELDFQSMPSHLKPSKSGGSQLLANGIIPGTAGQGPSNSSTTQQPMDDDLD